MCGVDAAATVSGETLSSVLEGGGWWMILFSVLTPKRAEVGVITQDSRKVVFERPCF